MISLTIGILAGFLCTISFIPQIVRIFKTRHTQDLSLVTFSLLCVGVFLWLIYGILTKDLPVILANSVILVLCSLIVVMKIKCG